MEWSFKQTVVLFCICSIAILTLLPRPQEVSAENRFYVQYEGALTSTDLSGPGQSQSGLTEGTRYINTINLNGNGTLGEFNYSFNLGAKATDDIRKDSEKLSLTNMRGRLSNKVHRLNLGDSYESFSRYSLNTAVKGGSYHYEQEGNNLPEITLVSGLAYSRWDNFWGVDAVERQVYGGRMKQSFSNKLWIAASAVQVDDSMRQNGSQLYDGNSLGIDWEYKPIPGLIVVGESSFSNIDENNTSTGIVEHAGNAHRFEAIGDGAPSRVILEFERVSPDYLSVLGSATPDREKAKTSWRYDYAQNIQTSVGFLWYRDNLHGQLATRTDHYKPEAGLKLRQFMGRRYATADFGYKFDRSTSDTSSTSNHFVNFGYQDRFGKFDSNTNVGFNYYETATTRDDNEFLANTTLSTRTKAGDWTLKPQASLGTWMLDNELSNQTDRVYEYSLGLGADLPKVKLTTNFKVGQHRLLKDSGDDSKKFFANVNIYYRPELLAKFKSSQIYARGLVNDYGYTTDTRDYRETSLTVGLRIRF